VRARHVGGPCRLRVHSGTARFNVRSLHLQYATGGTPMTNLVATLPDPEADIRWRDWQARGDESDRRTTTRMRRLMLVIATALAVWFIVQLT
jgi:hypothetical protein